MTASKSVTGPPLICGKVIIIISDKRNYKICTPVDLQKIRFSFVKISLRCYWYSLSKRFRSERLFIPGLI